MRVTTLAEEHDTARRTHTTLLRYEEVTADGAVEALERPWVLHWHTPDGFRDLEARAGLVVRSVGDADGRTAGTDARAFEVVLGRPAVAPDLT